MRLAAWLGFVFVAAGCSTGPPLSDCAFGLFHADCGGSGPVTFACDGRSGACRWFASDVVADGYLASDCPPEMGCCHAAPGGDTWPFGGGWNPGTPEQQLRRRLDMYLIGGAPIGRDGPFNMEVVTAPNPIARL